MTLPREFGQRASAITMTSAIREDARRTSRWTGITDLDPKTLRAMEQIPREKFVPSSLQYRAYDDEALPIGFDQTISQPFIVALMTDLIRPTLGMKVLEVGTGSGYQTAVLAALGCEVFTIERILRLLEKAVTTLQDVGFQVADDPRGPGTIGVRLGDGCWGWPDKAPYAGIIVTAAATFIPTELVDQLAAPGRMIIPVGGTRASQTLVLIEKDIRGQTTSTEVLPVTFVPLFQG